MNKRKQSTGKQAYYFGILAEDLVADKYQKSGFECRKRRYRGGAGEIDLIMARQDKLYFVEVKASKTFDLAAMRIIPKQVERIHSAALSYLAAHDLTLEIDMRFDLALVNAHGQIKVLPGALNDIACA